MGARRCPGHEACPCAESQEGCEIPAAGLPAKAGGGSAAEVGASNLPSWLLAPLAEPGELWEWDACVFAGRTRAQEKDFHRISLSRTLPKQVQDRGAGSRDSGGAQ